MQTVSVYLLGKKWGSLDRSRVGKVMYKTLNSQRLRIYRTGESSWVRDTVNETLIDADCIEWI